MIIRTLLLSLIFGSFFLDVAHACKCRDGQIMPVEEAIEKSNLALVGRVTKLEEIKGPSGEKLIEVTIFVEDVFKGLTLYMGKLEKQVDVWMPERGEDCRVEAFRVGDRFTVFAQEKQGYSELYTDLCWGNSACRTDGSSKDLDFLYANFPPQKFEETAEGESAEDLASELEPVDSPSSAP